MNKITGDIYMITNLINGKKYIGQSRNEKGGHIARWNDHQRRAYRTTGKRSSISSAIAKYGVENFIITLLEQKVFESIFECSEWMDSMESFYIDKFDSLKNGYNATSGGQRGYTPSDIEYKNRKVAQFDLLGNLVHEFESIKIARAETGINGISACCLKKTATAGGSIWRHHGDGMEFSETELNLVSRKYNKVHGTPVAQLSIDGAFIANHSDIKTAAEKIGVPYTRIIDCCTGRKKSVKGFVYAYLDDRNRLSDSTFDDLRLEHERLSGFSISQYDLTGNHIQDFDSERQAGILTGSDPKNIQACVFGRVKTIGGYIWTKSGDSGMLARKIDEQIVGQKPLPIIQRDKARNIVATYRSAREASIVTGIDAGRIRDCVSGFKKSIKGFLWEATTN